jgi:hypothetical protein
MARRNQNTIGRLPLRGGTRAIADGLRPLKTTRIEEDDYRVLGGEEGAGDGVETGRGGGRSPLVEWRRHARRHELGKRGNHARKAQDAQPARRLTQGAHHRTVVERHRDRAPEDPDGQQCHDDDEPKAHRVHTVPDAFSRVKDSTKFLRHPAMA